MTDDFDDLLGEAPSAGESNFQLALKLASQNFPVFPCRAKSELIKDKTYKEKTPLPRLGFKSASKDSIQIKRWWQKWPDALVGIPTGSASGLVALDLDRHPGMPDGVKAFKELGFNDETITPLRILTAGNGVHLLFKFQPGITNSDRHLPKGIDVRGEGGYIIAPGSRFEDGRRWSPVDLLQRAPDFPEELLPPTVDNINTGETGDNHRLNLSVEEIQEYLEDLPNDESVGRQEWIAIMAALHHEASAPDEDGEYRPKSEQNEIARLAVEWTAQNKTYASAEHRKQAKQDFWSFRDSPHKKLATFRSIAKVVIGVRREREIDEALNEFDDQDDLGEDMRDSSRDDFDDLLGFDDEEGGLDDLLGTSVTPKKKKVKKSKRDAWEDPAAPKYIQLMNKRHAVVRFNAKTYIVDFGKKGDDQLISLGDEKSLHMAYAPNIIETIVVDDKGNEKTKELTWSNLWLKSPYRRYYPKGIIFNPRESEEGALNLWQGLAIEADASGKCNLMLEHIERILCCGNKDYARTFLDYLAHMVQKPWERPTFSLVMRGEMGAGKDTPFRYLAEILGGHSITVGRNSDISGRFNGHLMGKILVHLQEGFFAGSREQANYMKFLLDSPKINIERKNVDVFATRAYHRTVMSSNDDWVAPVSWGERRYFILDVDNTYAYGSTEESQARNKAYFDPIDHQMKHEGGIEAFLHFLMTRDISNFDIRRPPKTEGLSRQLAEGFRDVDRWWKECLDAGSIDQFENADSIMRDAWERDWITRPADDLFNAYERWRMKQRHLGNSVTRTKFAHSMRRVCTSLGNRQVREKSTKIRVNIIPPLKQCRHEMEILAGGKLEWPDEATAPDTKHVEDYDDLG